MPFGEILAGLDMASPYIQMFAQNEMNKSAAKKQHKYNMELAAYQNQANTEYLNQQNQYNSPASQMRRFEEAGLNKNLIFGQGTPGNQPSAQQAADPGRVDWQQVSANMVPLLNQSKLVQAQVDATNAKTRQTYAVTELNKIQARVMEKNPLLNDEGFKATIDSLKATAEIKASESGMKASQLQIQKITEGHQANIVWYELQNIIQKYNLLKADGAIKAEVVKSKQFQNDMAEIQKKFMEDGSVSPGQILTFIQMLLLKLM